MVSRNDVRTARRCASFAASRGQAMVEFALVLPIFLLLVFGILDLGRIVFIKAQLENAVREGVRAGQVADPFDEDAVLDRVTQQPFLAGATVAAGCMGGCAYGSTLSVEATLETRFVGLGVFFDASPPTLRASASGRIE